MLIGFFSDPHLGLERTSNTTPQSRKALTQKMYDQAHFAIKTLRSVGCKDIYCLGDLFDRHSNKEKIIAQGAAIALQCRRTMAGNHDVINREAAMGSLQLLSELNTSTFVIAPKLDEPYYEKIRLSEHGSVGALWFVPHAATQALFEASLDEALSAERTGAHNILCLHCNVGETPDRHAEDEGTSLYLTDTYREKLLDAFDYILVGHEHMPQNYSDGRLRVLGNTFPVTFNEIGERFVTTFDTETGEIDYHQIFWEHTEYIELTARQVMDGVQLLPAVKFVRVSGMLASAELPQWAKALRDLWQNNSNLLMVNTLAVQTEKIAKAQVDNDTSWAPKTLPELVEQSIDATTLREPFDEAVSAVKQDAST